MLRDMGRDFCKTLAVYSEPDSNYYSQILTELQYMHDTQPSYDGLGVSSLQTSTVPNKNSKGGFNEVV